MSCSRRQFTFLMLGAPLVALGLLVPAATCRAETLYVSPGGALPSLEAARDKIRELRRNGASGSMTVLVRGGWYWLSQPFVLTPEDSGTVYAAYPNEHPILSGGRKIEGWKNVRDRIWSAPAPGLMFRQLFINGVRAQRARVPNLGFYRIDGPSSQDRPFRLKYRGNDILKTCAELSDVEAVVLLAWKEIRMQISQVDEAARVAVLTGNPSSSNREVDARYWIENAPEGLNAQGNWYLDRKAGTVSCWARGGILEEDEVIVPVLEQLVRLEGNPEKGQLVRNVTFRGLDFRHTDWTLGPRGYTSQQAAVTVPAALEAVGAEEVSIENCRFTQMAGYGIEFGRGTKRNRIVANEIFDMGGGGIKVGLPIHVDRNMAGASAEEIKMLEDEALASSVNVITDNEIHDLGLVFPSAVGIWVGQSDGNTVAHNHVHDLYFSGISVGWTWGYGPSRARNNIIEFNHVHNVGKNQVMSDMGGIYTLGTQPGTVVRNNLIHDVDRFTYGGWGIYTDGGSSKMVYENNVVYRCKSSPFHQNYGREQTVRNNIFAFGSEFQIMRSHQVVPDFPFTFERNIVYFDQGELMAGAWRGAGLRMDRNIFWDTRGDKMRRTERIWEEWRKLGQSGGSLIADPLFVDAANYDFTLRPESPAWKLGFQPIDIKNVGPRVPAGPQGLRVETRKGNDHAN